jgi:hypothetical protein
MSDCSSLMSDPHPFDFCLGQDWLIIHHTNCGTAFSSFGRVQFFFVSGPQPITSFYCSTVCKLLQVSSLPESCFLHKPFRLVSRFQGLPFDMKKMTEWLANLLQVSSRAFAFARVVLSTRTLQMIFYCLSRGSKVFRSIAENPYE